MPTPHIEAQKCDIAPIVIMPGDPLRAKHIVEEYFDDYKQVNSVRNMFGYTGHYKGVRMTVFASGMGMPSMGIYAYELYKFYDVEKIIRVGSCGALKENIKLLDVVMADSAYTASTFAKMFTGESLHEVEATKEVNNIILNKAKEKKINIHHGRIITTDVFDVYVDKEKYNKNFPSDLDYLAAEMETFALFFLAKYLNRQAASLLTVVDSVYDKTVVSSKDRQNSLNEMITLALDSLV